MEKIVLLAFFIIFPYETDQKCVTKTFDSVATRIISPYNYSVCEYKTPMLKFGRGLDIGNGTFKYIIFKDSVLKQVSADFFINCSTITELYLNNSKIELIGIGAFNGLDRLQELYLQQNDLTKLLGETWTPLKSLKKLDLSENRLAKITNLFSNMPALEELNLEHNRILQLENGDFEFLPKLKNLSLAHNHIFRIERGSFENLTSLEFLKLQHNVITHFNDFKPLINLKNLDFSSNKLKSPFELSQQLNFLNISNNDYLSNVNWASIAKVDTIEASNLNLSEIDGFTTEAKHLNLKKNNLREINATTFSKSTNLITIDLSSNSISKIGDGSFQKLTNLEILNLGFNKLKELPTGLFQNSSSLIELRLSTNQLENLKYGTFSGLDSLERLFLDNNKLSFVDERSFYVLRNLKILYFTNNLIENLDAKKLIDHLKSLQFIDINYNKWKCTSLFEVTNVLTDEKRGFHNGSDFSEENINGIGCKSDSLYKVIKQVMNSPKNKESELLIESPMISFDRSFKNSTFYKFFTSEYNNTAFFNYSRKDFRKSPFFRYFNKGFVNSKFYKFFEQDFKDSDFLKQLRPAESTKLTVINDNLLKETEMFNNSSLAALKSENEDAYNFASLADKITICLIVNVALVALMIFLLSFIVFRKQNKYKFVKFLDDRLDDDHEL